MRGKYIKSFAHSREESSCEENPKDTHPIVDIKLTKTGVKETLIIRNCNIHYYSNGDNIILIVCCSETIFLINALRGGAPNIFF